MFTTEIFANVLGLCVKTTVTHNELTIFQGQFEKKWKDNNEKNKNKSLLSALGRQRQIDSQFGKYSNFQES